MFQHTTASDRPAPIRKAVVRTMGGSFSSFPTPIRLSATSPRGKRSLSWLTHCFLRMTTMHAPVHMRAAKHDIHHSRGEIQAIHGIR